MSHESFGLTFESHLRTTEIEQAIRGLQQRDISELHPAVDERALQSLKFSDCLPQELAVKILQRRLRDELAIRHALEAMPRFVTYADQS